jgi:hypothetical protein
MSIDKGTKPIIRQIPFLITNGIIILAFIVLTIGILFFDQYKLSMTPHGYATFIEIFKLPLAVLAIIVPFNAFYISYIRSEQSRIQIQLLSSANNFSNYYKHFEEFEKHLKRNLGDLENYNVNFLYKAFYPNSISGDYSVCDTAIHDLERMINSFSKIIYSTANENLIAKKFELRKRVVLHLRGLIEYLDGSEPNYLNNHIRFINRSLNCLADTHESIKFIYMQDYYQYIMNCYKILDEVLKFDAKNSYFNLCLLQEHRSGFYKKMDGKGFRHSNEILEGEYSIKGYSFEREFKLKRT